MREQGEEESQKRFKFQLTLGQAWGGGSEKGRVADGILSKSEGSRVVSLGAWSPQGTLGGQPCRSALCHMTRDGTGQ